MRKWTTVYSGPGYPLDPKHEDQRQFDALMQSIREGYIALQKEPPSVLEEMDAIMSTVLLSYQRPNAVAEQNE